MTDKITLRWAETERYEIMSDENIVQLQAITNRGTYWTEIAFHLTEGYKGIGEARAKFKARVLEVIGQGDAPGYVEMPQEEAA